MIVSQGDEVDEYTPSGTFVQKLMDSSNGLELPTGSAFDGNGNLYVTDFLGDQILKRDAATGLVSVFANDASLADGHVFDAPESIVFNRGYTQMFVSDANRGGPGGGINIVNTSNGSGAGFYPLPSSSGSEGAGESDWLAFDSHSTLFMTNEDPTQGVMKVNASTGDVTLPSFASNLPNVGYALSFDKNGNVWIGDTSSILEFNTSGSLIRTISNNNFSTVFAAVFNTAGDQLYAGDLGNGNVYTYDLNGNLAATFSVPSGVDGLSVAGAAVPPNAGGFATQVSSNANEPIMAVNPTNPENIVIGFNHLPSSGPVRCGYSASFDGGQTWSAPNDLSIPKLKKQSSGGGDPALAFTSTGKLFAACLTTGDDGFESGTSPVHLYTALSSNGGKTFGPSTIVVHGSSSPNGNGAQPDQEALAASPTTGAVYVCYAFNVSSPGNRNGRWDIRVSRLDSAGNVAATGFVTVSTKQSATYGCSVSVAESGRVWVGWWDAGAQQADVAYSDNATSTSPAFSSPTVLGVKRGASGNAGGVRLPGRHVFVRASRNPGDNSVIAAWEDDVPSGPNNLDTRAFIGSSWTPLAVQFPGVLQPTIDWGSDGNIAYGFYQDSNGDGSSLTYTVAQASSPTGSFIRLQALAPAPSTVLTNLQPLSARFGDYTSAVEVGSTPYGAWTDNSAGSQTVWFGHL